MINNPNIDALPATLPPSATPTAPEPTVPAPPLDREAARRPRWPAEQQRTVQRVLILGGGFGGFYTAKRLEKLFPHHAGVEITLVSRDNYFLMTPLLFEAGSGILEPRHVVNPIRRLFKRARFIEADVERIDFDRRLVFARHVQYGRPYELPYDHLVLALGGVTNRGLIPGSHHAIAFKTLGDAIYLRNTIIDLCERADVAEDPEIRRRLLTIVVIGGGLVGIELIGELTEFMDNLLRSYPRIPRELVRFVLVEASPRILPEMEEDLGQYAADTLWKRGVSLITGTRVQKIEPGRIHLPPSAANPDGVIQAETILLAAGISANPLLADMPLTKARNGRIQVEATLRSPDRPEVWALGDCAVIPDPSGKPYPPLAQHALREARTLAANLAAVIQRPGKPAELQPFLYQTMGQLASLGHYNGVGKIMGIKLKGFLAWWAWRSYFMLQMPRLDRKIRVILDWTVALFFRHDVAKLDLFGEEHPSRASRTATPDTELAPSSPATKATDTPNLSN